MKENFELVQEWKYNILTWLIYIAFIRCIRADNKNFQEH